MFRAVSVIIAVAAVLATAGGDVGAITHVPPNAKNVKWWLGSWKTNFGVVYFAQIYRAKSDVPGPNDEPQYYWRVEGRWTMEGGRTVNFHGAIDPRDHLTYQGCYETPRREVGIACYPMLMYGNDARDRIAHGYWKPCFLPENCHSHHPWSGERKQREYRAGFRFTQRGFPDGQHTIRTQTGGAGALVWAGAPVANSDTHTPKDSGLAVHGSMLFTIDEIPEATNLNVTIEIKRGFIRTYGTRREPNIEATLEGLVKTSNDPHCVVGAYAAITLADRPEGKADRIDLKTPCRNERWTSTNPQRVNVHLERPTAVK